MTSAIHDRPPITFTPRKSHYLLFLHDLPFFSHTFFTLSNVIDIYANDEVQEDES